MDYEDIRAEADAFLEEFWPERQVPVNVERIVDARTQVDIVSVPDMKAQADVTGFLSHDMATIYVDDRVADPNRGNLSHYRFTLAHEIGHWYLHEHLYQAAGHADPEAMMPFIKSVPARDRSFYEWQARSFAGLVLLPRWALDDLLARAVQHAQDEGFEGLDLAVEAHRDYVAEWIGRRASVSAAVVLYRGGFDAHWRPR